MSASTTIQIQFGNGATSLAGAVLAAEVDSRSNGLNSGKTSFNAGATAWFLVYKSDNVVVTSVDCSAGSIGTGTSIPITKTEDVTFTNSATDSLRFPANSIVSVQWLGRDLGAITLGDDKTTLTIPEAGLGIAKVTYITTGYPYSLTAPATLNGLTDFPIAVLVTGDLV